MQTPPSENPKVFISYSHDSSEYVDRVLSFANRLRAGGIDCHIDQYEMFPSEGWPRWMINQIEAADFILVACTENYNLRFRGKKGNGGLGANWEGAILTQELYEAESTNSKFIPIVFASENIAHIPITLRSTTYYDLTLESGFQNLYRRLTNQPATMKPDLGGLQSMPPLERKQVFAIARSTNDSNQTGDIHSHDLKNDQVLNANSTNGTPTVSSSRSGSWIFGTLLLIFFICVFSFGPDTLPEYKTRMLALISALIAGLFGFFLTGDVGIEIKALQRFGTIAVKAAGGIALFVLTIVWWVSPFAPVKSTAAPIEYYKVQLTALDLEKKPVEDAMIWSSVGEPKKIPGGWELLVPAASLPPDKRVTVSIRTESPPLFRQIEVQVADRSVARTVELEKDTSSDVHGVVVGEDGQPISDAVVKLQGHPEETRQTDVKGKFEFPARWGRNEQVYLVIEKAGYADIDAYPHLAGETQAYIILKRPR